mgnify:CR=1 FL=1
MIEDGKPLIEETGERPPPPERWSNFTRWVSTLRNALKRASSSVGNLPGGSVSRVAALLSIFSSNDCM